jgi:glycerol kinase
MSAFILAIDQGTTSSRAMIFNHEGKPIHQHQIELTQHFPQNGWVEHDPEEIWRTTLTCCRKVITDASLRAADISAIGISNQRETTVIWDRKTGKPIYPAIVWQDRRTADYCQLLIRQGMGEKIQHKTGLLLDPYFSASKIKWILQHVEGARAKAINGELAFGTIDTYLLWQLTGGKQHATDATNASRTSLFNIHTQMWDEELLDLFGVPKSLLPMVLDNCAHFGRTDPHVFGHEISITGMAGDQQAATVGQACFQSGMVKSTYGTGCFVLLNTGEKAIRSNNRLLTTIAYRINGKVTYGLEGSIFVAGAAVQWLRDALHLIKSAAETQTLAASVENTGGVYLIPAFTGLGAPYWDPQARGALLGLTRDTHIAHIVRATLEAVCYQTRDLMGAMISDSAHALQTLRVDGGMAANDWLLQFLTDILHVEVERPRCIETSALGAAFLAGLGAGIYSSLAEISQLWQADKSFVPSMPSEKREALYAGWRKAINRIISHQHI